MKSISQSNRSLAEPPALPDSRFSFDAGAICLDFANTVDWHASPSPEEKLLTYADLVEWALAGGILSPGEARLLLEKAGQQPEEAKAALEQARTLREAIYGIFRHLVAGAAPKESDLETLNAGLRLAMTHVRLIPPASDTESRFTWGWERVAYSLDSPWWPAIRSAGDLLASGNLSRLGQCADDRGCGWLFLDLSRNRSRRWCSMESCGNRAKALRHYRRGRQDNA